MSINDKLSVIVPIYNVERYLKKCIDSIINQTYKNLEIILVDDGSTDNSGNICDGYALKDRRIKVIHKENGGLSDARNKGIEISTGNYITFVDSDDWLELDMYETLVTSAVKNSVKLAIGGVKVYDESSEKFRKDYDNILITEKIISKEEFVDEIFLGIWSCWDKIYHKSIFDKVRFPIGEFNEDEAVMMDIIDQCNYVYITTKPLYVHYVRASNSITANRFSIKKVDWFYHSTYNLYFVRKKYFKSIEKAEYRYYLSLIWCLNNMTADLDQFKDIYKRLLKILRKEIVNIIFNKYLGWKEKVRSLLMFFNYKLYGKFIKILGKKYT